MSFNRKRRLKNPAPVTCESLTGTIVLVLTGRTRGKKMVLLSTVTDKDGKCMALVADGVRYTVKAPKLKAASHLEELQEKCETLKDEEIKKSVYNQ